MTINRMWRVTGFVLCSGFASATLADFGVAAPSQPTDYYGNGQSATFRRAIAGGEPLTPEEQAEIQAQLPEKDSNRYYGRFRVNASSLIFGNIKNRSASPNNTAGVGNKRAVQNQTGLEIAIGYTWTDMRWDLEYLVNRNLLYNANPVLTGVNPQQSISGSIKNNTILANGYYDITGFGRIQPYFTGGLGVSVNTINSTVTPSGTSSGSHSVRTASLAYQLGAGIRMRFFEKWYFDFSYRYIFLGNKLNMNPSNTVNLQGQYSMNAISVGFIYLF